MELQGPHKKEARESIGERPEDAMLLALKIGKGSWTKEYRGPPEAREVKNADSPLETPEGIQSCPCLDFSPVWYARRLMLRTVRQICAVLSH